MIDKLYIVGHITETISALTHYEENIPIVQSEGLLKHIQKRHPDCMEYYGLIPVIISHPDYIGMNPNEKGKSFELVKTFSNHVQIGIKLSSSEEYFYVATLHTIADSKIERRVSSGRLKKIVD